MNVRLNGEWRQIGAEDLAGALEELGLAGAVVATALNGEFVPAQARSTRRLTEGDALEVLSPMQGG